MTEYIRDENGKFAGSVGDGKTAVPPAGSVPPGYKSSLSDEGYEGESVEDFFNRFTEYKSDEKISPEDYRARLRSQIADQYDMPDDRSYVSSFLNQGDPRLTERIPCRTCGRSCVLTAELSAWEDYRRGGYIQNSFAGLPAEAREMLQSGICGTCWNEIFSDDEEEDPDRVEE